MKAKELLESTSKIPNSNEEVEYLKEIFSQPLPARDANVIIGRVIIDDGLIDEIDHICKLDPERDCREVLSTWIKQCMPELFTNNDFENEDGFNSTIPGHPDQLDDTQKGI